MSGAAEKQASPPTTGSDAVELLEDIRPLGQMLIHSARRDGEHEALVFPDARLTYADLARGAWKVALSLAGLGIRPGEHVGLLMTNHPDLIKAYFGVLTLGAVAVPINARYRTEELAFLVGDADLVAVLTHDAAAGHVDFAGLLASALPGLADAADARELRLPGFEALRSIVMMGDSEPPGLVGQAEFKALADEADDEQVADWAAGVPVRSPALVLYTSGTTAQPRGAIITHEAFLRIWRAAGRRVGTTVKDRHWNALPLFHVTALGAMTWVLDAGGTFFSDYAVDPERALETIVKERVTEFYPAYPTVMEGITGDSRFELADVASIRVFINVAPPEQLAKFQARLPHAVQLTTYGGTEGGPVTLTRLDDPMEVRIGTCGDPQPGVEVEIRDEDGNRLDPGRRGEIHYRGFNTFSGYYRHPEKTAETLLPGGWVKPGDLGVLDPDGRLLFLGRSKETFKVGGENVAPQEIEERLVSHPEVKIAQVVAIPDERLQEVPAAYVELRTAGAVTEEELIDYCRGSIASFKVPRIVRFIEASEWPLSTTKIQRFKLRERLLAELDSES